MVVAAFTCSMSDDTVTESIGRVEHIWLKRAKGGPMDGVPAATLEPGQGLHGNANRGGKRQVTLIAAERWRELTGTLGADLDPSTRRANVLLSGIDLEESRGRILRIGATRLQINGETRPCEQMEEACAGLTGRDARPLGRRRLCRSAGGRGDPHR